MSSKIFDHPTFWPSPYCLFDKSEPPLMKRSLSVSQKMVSYTYAATKCPIINQIFHKNAPLSKRYLNNQKLHRLVNFFSRLLHFSTNACILQVNKFKSTIENSGRKAISKTASKQPRLFYSKSLKIVLRNCNVSNIFPRHKSPITIRMMQKKGQSEWQALLIF